MRSVPRPPGGSPASGADRRGPDACRPELPRAPAWARGLAAVCVGLLAACGGGTGGAAPEDAAPRAVAQALSAAPGYFPPGLAIPANAATHGLWSPVYAWPLIAVHAVVLPDGRVLSYGTDTRGVQTGHTVYDVWDGAGAPDAGHMTLPNGTGIDLFCSAQLVLPEAAVNVALTGGDNWTGTATTNTGNANSTVFAASGNRLNRGADMNRARWYAAMTTLVNGELYLQGGNGGEDRPEIRDRSGSFRLLGGADTSALDPLYPRNWVAPNGRVFSLDGAGRMVSVDTGGNGSLQRHGQIPRANAGGDASSAMFQPGRILQFGGNSNGAIVIDLNGGSPSVTATGSMSSQRRLVSATILPDGQVLATGGSREYNKLVGVNNIAEIWNPRTGRWAQGASGARARLYHSNAILLPDASVLVMGGGALGPVDNLNVEIYYPPYFFGAGGQRAARPAITGAPAVLDIGKTFRLDVAAPRGVSRVTLVKTSSATHSVNMDQRFVELTFKAEGGRIVAQAPARAVDATPGYYWVFVIDTAGVPSVARSVRIPVAGNPAPQTVPSLASPGDRQSTLGAAVQLRLSAHDPNGDALAYSAAGLPAGLRLDAASGLISGQPERAGRHDVTVSASDGINADSRRFAWTILAPAPPLEIRQLDTAGAVRTGRNARFEIAATGSNLRYRWDFGDGSATTAWSASPTVEHAYGRPGTYVVTVTVADDQGDSQSRTLVQSVHLPPTARAPSVSGNLLVTEPRRGNARLWVVNPDNDSVSVFDTVSRRKLAELAVGASPRTIAQGGDGAVYVSNYRGASISVIDADKLEVVDRIRLGRGAAPYGLAASPTSDHLYAVLEGPGELHKIRLSDGATVAKADVGAHARHVSVSAGGQRVFVSRYITPPLPGESTRKVALAGDVGGEVLSLEAGKLKLERTIRLVASRKADAENQGRGVPNYLGAVAISPDGTQAWVPSKQDNIERGVLRDKRPLNFQNTVRAVSSRLDLKRNRHDAARRIDHDNAGVASAALYDRHGSLLFVALETSREVAVLDAWSGAQLMRIATGRAPQGLALGPDGKTLYVHEFMDRSVGVYDLAPLLEQGRLSVPRRATLDAVGDEKLVAKVLAGKRLFYDARDARLARDRYISCASCHADGMHDGRVWDMTGFGEGLRNTISLRGHAGQGPLHWSGNFDEVQDFEGQIRALAGGTGLMTQREFETGSRSRPLGDPKAGVSDDLDRLAAYVNSLRSTDDSPLRPSGTRLSARASEGRKLFRRLDCASCHGGGEFTLSARLKLQDIGTLKAGSGQRLGARLRGLDVPTLRGVGPTAPYLHDGSAATLQAAIKAHEKHRRLARADLDRIAAYLLEVDDDEGAPP